MLSEISIETVSEDEVPTGRGRPGPALPSWLLQAITKSADKGVWLSATFKAGDDAEELAKLLRHVNRSKRYGFHVATRREDSDDGHRVLFKAERTEGGDDE
ncbi:hypothetical protein ABT072_08470 [Streptomyces sp. NPDC002589]|uniref:hypothetical protein n=1 Tax=Streptomyces sp. NPDC002589 TaxID=3154420 RepID=UPI0033326E35